MGAVAAAHIVPADMSVPSDSVKLTSALCVMVAIENYFNCRLEHSYLRVREELI